MRIIRFFVSMLVVLTVVGGVGFVLGREALLLFAQSQLKSHVTSLTTLPRNTSYRKECYDKIGSQLEFETTIARVQLRFLNDTEYVTEVVCQLRPEEPIRVDSFELPPFVTKAPGSSGIVWSEVPSGVTLQLWGRQAAVAFEKNKSIVAKPGESYSLYPAAECRGYGYECCAPDVGQAGGELVKPVTDCPTQCYSQCQARPAVLSFVSDPLPDPQTRTVQLKKGERITFFYVFESRQNGEITGTIEFGDGKSQILDTTQGEVTHEYQCPQTTCSYQVTLTVLNTTTGVQSVSTALSTLNIILE